MQEQVTKEETFRQAPPLDMPLRYSDGTYNVQIAECYPHHITLVSIRDADLDVAQARALRDWLNKVLP